MVNLGNCNQNLPLRAAESIFGTGSQWPIWGLDQGEVPWLHIGLHELRHGHRVNTFLQTLSNVKNKSNKNYFVSFPALNKDYLTM